MSQVRALRPPGSLPSEDTRRMPATGPLPERHPLNLDHSFSTALLQFSSLRGPPVLRPQEQ